METASFSLRQGLRDSAHQLGLASFWRWWIGQLASLTPASVRAAVQRRRLRPVLACDASTAVLWEPRVDAGSLAYAESARIDLIGDAATVARAGRTAIERLPLTAYGGGVGSPGVLVALPASKVLRKRLVLPAAVEQNLKQALAYDLDRHTPFRAEELYFDATVAERNVARREIVVEWAAARRADVDQARRVAEGFGARVVGVAANAPDQGDPARLARLNLLPDADRIEQAWWRRWHIWIPLVLLAAAAAVALLLPIWQKRDYTIALSRQVDEAHQQAVAADALRAQLEQQMGDYNFVLAKKYGYVSATQLLDDVTKLLPDDTWLTQLEVRTIVKGKEAQREIQLRGESVNAGRLISLLEESRLFEQAAPRSPTTKIQPGPGEIFDIGAQLKPLPPPLAVAPDTAVVAAGAPAPADRPAAPPAAPAATAPASASTPVPAAAPPATAPPAAAPPSAVPAAAPVPAAPPASTPAAATAPPSASAPSAAPAGASVPGVGGGAPAARPAAGSAKAKSP
jgi:general secretion pathway protein L